MTDRIRRVTQLTIRKFRTDDYARLIEMWSESKLPHKPKGRDSKMNIAREVEQKNAVFLVAEKNGELIGSAFGTHDGRKGWINRVAVTPGFRRKGVAEQLVNEVERQLRGMGIGIIACLIEEWNKDSMQFFEKMGYERHHDIYYYTKRKDADV